MRNKRGVTVLGLFGAIFFVLFAGLFLAITTFIFVTIDQQMSKDIQVGQVNLGEVHNQTMGLMTRGLVAQMDAIALVILFGILIVMAVAGIGLAENHPRVFFLVDTFLLVAIFIGSSLLSAPYKLIINNPQLSSTFQDNLPNMTKFILNLPIWATITGFFIMIFTYGLSKKIKETREQRGVQDVIGFGE